MMSATEIRQLIIDTVAKRGGHLASSLGAVELSMAIAEVFEPERDRVVWDVGHQAYAWKIVTGRAEQFGSLRSFGGISGFPNPSESAADAAVAGHAGVSISTALGLAAARDLNGGDEQVIAVVGDGALVNGVSFEALNNAAAATRKIIVILNDNEMSISRPTGSIARLLGRLITGIRYNRVKAVAEETGHRLKLTFLRGVYHSLERRIKSLFLGNAYFEQFGLRYIGPVDGHDLKALRAALVSAKEYKRSVIVHVVTKKGKGFSPAEQHPTKWHGVGAFGVEKPKQEAGVEKLKSWSEVFGETVTMVAIRDERIVALTAGMADGTGLKQFSSIFPHRFYDVGIAEEHMTAFAAGLAAGGKRPVVAVYSTFLQRAVDQIIHDIALPNLPVIFCVDRAGVVGADGATHQGVFDIALLRAIPNLTICQPKDAEDLSALFDEAVKRQGPTVIRYPRGTAAMASKGALDSARDQGTSAKIAIWATGDWLGKAEEVAAQVGGEVVHARYIKPIDEELLASQRSRGLKIVAIENASATGGLGDAIGADIRLGWPDRFIPHGTIEQLEATCGLDVESIVRRIREEMGEELS